MKNKGGFFVMLNTPDGGYTPLMLNDYEMKKFQTEDEARKLADDNPYGSIFGYEVFQIGTGI